MKTIVFMGAPEKSHLLLTLGRLLTELGQKVLMVDSTTRQTMQAYLPEPEHRWTVSVTEFAHMDVAIGFMAYAQLDYYFQDREGGWPIYDVLLLDTDHSQFMNGQELAKAQTRVWCSSFHRRELLHNVDLLQQLDLAAQPLSFYPLQIPFVPTTLSLDYIQSLYASYPIQWQEPTFQLSEEERDRSAILDNQHHGRIHVRHLSGSYVESVWGMASAWFNLERRSIRAAWKQMRRGDRRG